MRILSIYRNSPIFRFLLTVFLIGSTSLLALITHSTVMFILPLFYLFHLVVTVVALYICNFEEDCITNEERSLIGPAKLIVAAWMVMNPVSDDGYVNFAWVSLAVLFFLSGAGNLYVVMKDTLDAPDALGKPTLEHLERQRNQRKAQIEQDREYRKIQYEQEIMEDSLLADLSSYLNGPDPSRK